MFCRKCGAKIPDGSQFCIQCGNKVDGYDNIPIQDKKVPKKIKKSKLIFWTCIILVCTYAVYYVTSLNKICGHYYYYSGYSRFSIYISKNNNISFNLLGTFDVSEQPYIYLPNFVSYGTYTSKDMRDKFTIYDGYITYEDENGETKRTYYKE